MPTLEKFFLPTWVIGPGHRPRLTSSLLKGRRTRLCSIATNSANSAPQVLSPLPDPALSPSLFYARKLTSWPPVRLPFYSFSLPLNTKFSLNPAPFFRVLLLIPSLPDHSLSSMKLYNFTHSTFSGMPRIVTTLWHKLPIRFSYPDRYRQSRNTILP